MWPRPQKVLMGGGVEGKVVGWAATDRLLDGSLVVLVHSGSVVHLVGEGGVTR